MKEPARIKPPMLKTGDTVGFIAPCWRMKEDDLRPAADPRSRRPAATSYASCRERAR